MPTCKDCEFFVQGDGKGGTCKKRPYMLARNGEVKLYGGEPMARYIYWSSTVCKEFERRKT